MKRVRINNQIRVSKLRVIVNDGENLGVISIEEAIKKSQELGLDLIEISPNAKPPVAKIMDYGKYQYEEKKKLKDSTKKAHTVEVKSIQVGIGTSEHDLELKAKRADSFLREGNRVKASLVLKGRAKYLDKVFINKRLERVLNLISESYKIADGPKKAPRGISIIIEPTKEKTDERSKDK